MQRGKASFELVDLSTWATCWSRSKIFHLSSMAFHSLSRPCPSILPTASECQAGAEKISSWRHDSGYCTLFLKGRRRTNLASDGRGGGVMATFSISGGA